MCSYLMWTKVPLTFLIFIGRADPVPRNTTSGRLLSFSAPGNKQAAAERLRITDGRRPRDVAPSCWGELTARRRRINPPALVHLLQEVGDLRGFLQELVVVAGGDGVPETGKTRMGCCGLDTHEEEEEEAAREEERKHRTDLCHSMTGRSWNLRRHSALTLGTWRAA